MTKQLLKKLSDLRKRRPRSKRCKMAAVKQSTLSKSALGIASIDGTNRDLSPILIHGVQHKLVEAFTSG